MSRGGVTEHTVKFPDGIEMLYKDCGPVPGSNDYTTLVVLHGAGFNLDGFRPVMEHAHQNNFRIVNCNRRHYRGSTPYTDQELDDLKNGRKVFFDKLGAQLAWLLEHLVRVENIPKPDSTRTTGGVVVMGWSFGAATALTVLSDPEVIPKPVYETIEPYLRNIVIYDPPYMALGTDDPLHEVYHPWKDENLGTPEQVAEFFRQWVSSYYNHPDLNEPVYNTATLDYRKGTDNFTISKWTDDQKENWFEGLPVGLTDIPAFHGEPRKTLSKQTHRVIHDEAQVSTFFPKVKLIFISAEHTGWHSVHAYKMCQKQYEEALSRGEKPRKITFLCVEGGNHFMHYECPDVLLAHVIKGMKA